MTLGGQISTNPEIAGPRDRSETQKRKDVLVYTTEPLEHDVEVTGPVEVKLFAASSAVGPLGVQGNAVRAAAILAETPGGSASSVANAVPPNRPVRASAEVRAAETKRILDMDFPFESVVDKESGLSPAR